MLWKLNCEQCGKDLTIDLAKEALDRYPEEDILVQYINEALDQNDIKKLRLAAEVVSYRKKYMRTIKCRACRSTIQGGNNAEIQKTSSCN